jgi:hypothetical protein
MAVNDMLKKRQNGISKRNKMMRGGNASDTAYSISSYILLFISYIFFGFATILLINAGINYNKANIDETAVESGTPLIEQPTFEYLKRDRDNFMAIEEYLLVWNKPFAIIFYCIIGLCGIGIVSSKPNEIQGNLTKPTFLIALAIYGVMLGILIGYNVISSFKGNMPTGNLAILLEDEIGLNKDERKPFYNELKTIIIDSLNKNKDYTTAKKYMEGKVASSTNTKITEFNKKNVEKNLVSGYILYYYYKATDKNKYINYINNYFDLLSNDDKPEDNKYIRYYIYGLLETQDKTSKDALTKPLLNFKRNIQGYYTLVFALYGLFFIAAFIILAIDKPFMNFLTIYKWDIGKVIIGFFIIYIPIWLTMLL